MALEQPVIVEPEPEVNKESDPIADMKKVSVFENSVAFKQWHTGTLVSRAVRSGGG